MCVFRRRYGKTYDVVLGAGQVIPGMEQGLLEMCVGEKRKLIVPPHLGYGERGVGKALPLCLMLFINVSYCHILNVLVQPISLLEPLCSRTP